MEMSSWDESRTRTFAIEDQLRFAELSGDANPIHVDPIAARRLTFGAPIVHGLQLVLWGLEGALDDCSDQELTVQRITVKFKKPVRLNEQVDLKIESETPQTMKLRISDRSGICAIIEIEIALRPTDMVTGIEKCDAAPTHCRALKFEDISQRVGKIPAAMNQDLLSQMYPSIARQLPRNQVAGLLASTLLVGMECPGLHSIFAGFSFLADNNEANHLSYWVETADERFNLVTMKVSAPGLSGEVSAFVRPAPAAQASFDTVSKIIPKNNFSGQSALVIGGSRGLGEVAAKLFVGGGGRLHLTYHAGADDAEKIRAEISAGHGDAKIHQCDVTSEKSLTELASRIAGKVSPDYLFYFAAPRIEPTAKGQASDALLALYRQYFVKSFENAVRTFHTEDVETQFVFYPSTIYLETAVSQFSEYCTAKREGEALCHRLESEFPGLRIYTPRLPRMTTDQTVGINNDNGEDPAQVLSQVLLDLKTAA
jgi:hypothetical protein